MNIIFYCHTGVHNSLVAAAAYLGRLPIDRTPSKKEIATLPYFNSIRYKQIGTPYFIGKDIYGNKIYTLGLGFDHDLMEKGLLSFISKMNLMDNCKLINTILKVHPWTRRGSIISSLTGLHKLTETLITYGIRKNYNYIISMAQNLNEIISLSNEGDKANKVIPFPLDRVKRIRKV